MNRRIKRSVTLNFVALPAVAMGVVLSSVPADAASMFNIGDSLDLTGFVQGNNGAILFGTNPGIRLDPVAAVGAYGQTRALGAGSGGFDDIADLALGSIKSFDPATSTNTFANPFIRFLTPGDDYAFTLRQPPTFDFTNASIGQVGFQGTGRVRNLNSGQTVSISYDFTGQGLGDGAGVSGRNGPIDTNFDGITGIGSYSGTGVTIRVIPEPSTIFGSAFALLGAAYLASKRKNARKEPQTT